MIESGGVSDRTSGSRETSSGKIGNGPEKDTSNVTDNTPPPFTRISKEKHIPKEPESHPLFVASDSSDKDKPKGEFTPVTKKEKVSETAIPKEKPPRHPEKESVDPHLDSLIEKSKQSLGNDGAEKVVEAGKRFDEKYEGELKGTLAKIPDVVNAAHAAKLDPETTQDLLLHTINAPKGESAPKNYDNLNSLTRGLGYSSAHKEALSTEDAGALKGMITAGAEKNVISDGLRVYEAGRMAGLSLEDSVSLVKTVTANADQELAGHEVSRFGNTLKTLHLADADSEKVKKIFTEVAQLPSEQDRRYAHSDFREGIDKGLKAGEKPKAFVETIANKMDSGETINEALFSEITRLEEIVPPRNETIKSEEAIAERKKELQRQVHEAFANPQEVIQREGEHHSEEVLERAKTSFIGSDLSDNQIINNESAEQPEVIYRITVDNPEEYKTVLEVAYQKLVEEKSKSGEQPTSSLGENFLHECEHGAVAERANDVREDTHLKVAYNIEITNDPKLGKGINPYVAIMGRAPLSVFREFIRGPHDLSPADNITLGIHPHKHGERT